MDSLGSTPGGASILITSAPKSARMRQQVGPARTRVRSRTRRCDNALDGIGLVMVSSTPHPLIPAEAGTQHLITDSRQGPDPRFRGDERGGTLRPAARMRP